MARILALILVLIGLTNATLASAGVDDCCSSLPTPDAAESVSATDAVLPAHDCSSSTGSPHSDDKRCVGCGFLGHCSLALTSKTEPEIRSRPGASHSLLNLPALTHRPASFLDPPIA